MVPKLPFQLVANPVDRGGHILSFGMCPEGLSGDPQRSLHPFDPVGPWVVLVDELEVEGGGARLQASKRGELLLRKSPDRLGHLQASPRERHVHPVAASCHEIGLSSG
jgi:hypothetical protein